MTSNAAFAASSQVYVSEEIGHQFVTMDCKRRGSRDDNRWLHDMIERDCHIPRVCQELLSFLYSRGDALMFNRTFHMCLWWMLSLNSMCMSDESLSQYNSCLNEANGYRIYNCDLDVMPYMYSDPLSKNRYLIMLKDDVKDTNVMELCTDGGDLSGHCLRMYSSNYFKGVLVSSSFEGLDHLLKKYTDMVQHVEVDGVIQIALSGTQTEAPWGLDRIDQLPGVKEPFNNEYSYSFDGTGVNVYLFDTDIRTTHLDFRYLNGDKTGLNFGQNASSSRAQNAVNLLEDVPKGRPCNGHGTHTAAVVGGLKSGVAKGALIRAEVDPTLGDASQDLELRDVILYHLDDKTVPMADHVQMAMVAMPRACSRLAQAGADTLAIPQVDLPHGLVPLREALSPEERATLEAHRGCLHCRQDGHTSSRCPYHATLVRHYADISGQRRSQSPLQPRPTNPIQLATMHCTVEASHVAGFPTIELRFTPLATTPEDPHDTTNAVPSAPPFDKV
ncbi:hypothetical protein CBR_g49570 [Chara braunii]|uniref:Subtilisin n=1 Tax=Chara braunii TaxID=69332 RepID=A0A388M558_CHABU|nr:hypothetical protein CBR_g49570 [Chara braunii]|eukprot:GBG89717.1 hypothetical protein CBR_g49570 [Chara braunii]